jgi:hypothetical protein
LGTIGFERLVPRVGKFVNELPLDPSLKFPDVPEPMLFPAGKKGENPPPPPPPPDPIPPKPFRHVERMLLLKPPSFPKETALPVIDTGPFDPPPPPPRDTPGSSAETSLPGSADTAASTEDSLHGQQQIGRQSNVVAGEPTNKSWSNPARAAGTPPVARHAQASPQTAVKVHRKRGG